MPACCLLCLSFILLLYAPSVSRISSTLLFTPPPFTFACLLHTHYFLHTSLRMDGQDWDLCFMTILQKSNPKMLKQKQAGRVLWFPQTLSLLPSFLPAWVAHTLHVHSLLSCLPLAFSHKPDCLTPLLSPLLPPSLFSNCTKGGGERGEGFLLTACCPFLTSPSAPKILP